MVTDEVFSSTRVGLQIFIWIFRKVPIAAGGPRWHSG